MSTPLLWQFRYSHFNEKVRWALEYKGIHYKRQNFTPGLHFLPVMAFTGQRQLPVLQVEGRLIKDSRKIVSHLETMKPEPSLYPADPEQREKALEWETYLGENFGPQSRLLFFNELFKDLHYAGNLLTKGMAIPVEFMYRMGLPFTAMAVRFDLNLTESKVAESKQQVDQVFTRLEQALCNSDFLVGDQFSIADLTAAALGAPLIHTTHFSYDLPQPLPAVINDLIAQYENRPAVKWMRDISARFRKPESTTEAIAQ